MKKLAGIVAAVALATSIGCAGTANAAELTATANFTSLPYVEDVNPVSSNAYDAVVVCYGGHGTFQLRAVDAKAKKATRAKRIGQGQWLVRMKKGREYKLSVRVKGTAWKSIGYRIY